MSHFKYLERLVNTIASNVNVVCNKFINKFNSFKNGKICVFNIPDMFLPNKNAFTPRLINKESIFDFFFVAVV